MTERAKKLFDELLNEDMVDDWSWSDLSDILIKTYGWYEATEVVQTMVCFGDDKDKVLEEICAWANVENTVRKNLLRRLLEEDL